LNWSASENAAWLTLSPGTGTGTGSVTLTTATGTLTTGSYSGTGHSVGARRAPRHCPRHLHRGCGPGAARHRRQSHGPLLHRHQGGTNPAAQTLAIHNTGGGTLNWSASENAAWLTLSPGTGTGTGSVTLTTAHRNLDDGSYSAP